LGGRAAGGPAAPALVPADPRGPGQRAGGAGGHAGHGPGRRTARAPGCGGGAVGGLTRMLEGLLRQSARLVPPGRRQWAEAGVAGLVVLPWVGRRRGWFGPVGSSRTVRLVRVAGCAAVCGLGVAVVRMDSHVAAGPHSPGPFSLPREIIALVMAGAALAALPVVKARW